MILAQILVEACTLMHGLHYIRSSELGHIFQLTNHRLVLESALVVWGRINLMAKKSLITHRNRLWSGPETKTYILDYLLSKCWLRELILSVPLLLDVYPQIFSRLPLVLYLKF